jgi:uncharacterized protein YodC (DUF2158 family)
MENAFKDGDIVVLKSGGPNMTVEVASTYMTGLVYCSWFDGKKVKKEQFQPEALKLAEPAKFGLAG